MLTHEDKQLTEGKGGERGAEKTVVRTLGSTKVISDSINLTYQTNNDHLHVASNAFDFLEKTTKIGKQMKKKLIVFFFSKNDFKDIVLN